MEGVARGEKEERERSEREREREAPRSPPWSAPTEAGRRHLRTEGGRADARWGGHTYERKKMGMQLKVGKVGRGSGEAGGQRGEREEDEARDSRQESTGRVGAQHRRAAHACFKQ